MQFQFGDLATWVGALGTTGAFGVSLTLLYQALKDRRVSQAQRVVAWQVEIQPATTPDATYVAVIIYRLLNGNDTPVYNVVFQAPCGVRGTFVKHIGLLAPNETRDIRVYLPGAPRASQYPPNIAFTDSAGRYWYRRGDRGALKQIRSSQVEELIKEDPGAYESIDEHPTLHMN